MAARGRQNADEPLAVGLAGGLTVKEAARKAGVSERTAYRRLEDPEFRRHVAALRTEMTERAVSQLADAQADAALALRRLLKAKTDTVKLGAARSILELASKLQASVELERRLAELERRLAERKGP
jgi:hypothetical protein